MNATIISAEMRAILNKYEVSCSCDGENSCEVCNEFSLFNRLKKEFNDYSEKLTLYEKGKHYNT